MQYNFIDLKEFLEQSKLLNFDYLLGFTKLSDDGKVLKIPIKGTNDFTNPNVKIKEVEIIKAGVKNPEKVPYSIIGIILKEKEGLKIFDKQLVVVDIDCKNAKDKSKEAYNIVLQWLKDLGISEEKITNVTEGTVSGGWHIFLTSPALYPQKKLRIMDGVDIEIFSQNRYIAVAPSIGYSVIKTNSTNCVSLIDSYQVTVNSMDLDHFCARFESSDEANVASEIEINPKFIFDSSNWKKITANWDEFDRFVAGKSDKDWDNITKLSTYDYVRYNIMPIYALFDKVDEFLRIIERYGSFYLKQWQKYPEKWLEKWHESDIVLGKEARKRLFKAGLLKDKKQGNTKQDLIDDFVIEQMPVLFKNVMIVYDAIYYYNEYYKCYLYLEKNTFYETLGLHYKNKLGIILKPEDYRTLHETFDIYAKIFSVDENHRNYIHYDMLKSKSYYRTIPIVFKNGTLYLEDNKYSFEYNKFDPMDRAMYSVQLDFSEKLLEPENNSVVMNWFETKFVPDELRFIQLFFGNLLVPAYSPSVMLVMFSYKGALGKSTLVKTLSSLFDVNSSSMITTLPVTKLDNRFGGGNLSKALLNVTTELEGHINAEVFKSVVSREKWMVENKFENIKFEIPIAKHMSMSNDIPMISSDGGVTRRLAVFELNEDKAMPDVEAHRYEQMFTADKENLLAFMLQGLVMLKKLEFLDLSTYYMVNYPHLVEINQRANSPIYEWAALEGVDLLKNAGATGITEDELFMAYSTWSVTNNLPVNKKRYFLKLLLSNANIRKLRIDNDSRLRIIWRDK